MLTKTQGLLQYTPEIYKLLNLSMFYGGYTVTSQVALFNTAVTYNTVTPVQGDINVTLNFLDVLERAPTYFINLSDLGLLTSGHG